MHFVLQWNDLRVSIHVRKCYKKITFGLEIAAPAILMGHCGCCLYVENYLQADGS